MHRLREGSEQGPRPLGKGGLAGCIRGRLSLVASLRGGRARGVLRGARVVEVLEEIGARAGRVAPSAEVS